MAVLPPVVIALNPISRPFAAWLPFFGVLTNTGRRTGETYRTPINVFRRNDRYVFFLTYGSDVQWVKNVLAAGGCSLRTLGRDQRLVDPKLIVDPTRRLVPRPVRTVGRLMGVTEFLQMRAAPANSG